MMKFFQNISIRNKLIIIIFSVSMLTTMFSLVIDIFRQINNYQEELVSEVKLNAQLIAEYVRAPIEFDDPAGADSVLQKLDIMQTIVSGYVFTNDDKLYASYKRDSNYFEAHPIPGDSLNIKIDEDILGVNYPINFNGRKFGTVYLRASTNKLKQQIEEYFSFTLIVIFALAIFTFFLARSLQKYISQPILVLADITRDITARRDFSVRVEKESNDEIGNLYDEFNEMLEQLTIKDAQRDRVEAALKLNEYRLKKAQQIAKVGSWEYIPAENKLMWSDQMYRIFGVEKGTPETDLKLIFLNSIFPGDLARLKKMIVQSNGIVPEFIEYRIIRSDGELRYLRAGGDFIFSEDDKVNRIGVVQDFTEQKEAELEVFLSKQRFENIFNSAPVSIWEEDQSRLVKLLKGIPNNGENSLEEHFEKHPEIIYEALKNTIIVDANEASIALFESSSKEELINGFEKIIIPESIGVLKKLFLAIMEKRQTFESEIALQTLMGKRIDAIIRITSLNSSDMKDRTLVSIIDITELKKLDSERENLLEEITQKNTELEQIIYVSSHDLRSPLVNIQGFGKELELSASEIMEVIEEEEDITRLKKKIKFILEEEIPPSLRFIRTSASKMDTLLKGLLRLSRLGRAALNIERVDMNQLFGRITDAMQFQIKQADLKIEIKDLAPCSGDAVQINQLFTNILDNAIKYLHPGRRGLIKISSVIKNDYSVYCIEDNGIGINPDHKEKVFEIFHRLNPEAGVSGEGLGLAIVKRILQRHNGLIWVESEENVGSKFYVQLPLF